MDNYTPSGAAIRAAIMILTNDAEKQAEIFSIFREDQKKQTDQHTIDMIEAKAIIADAIESNFPLMEETK